jgi:hypothetical protein
MRWVIAIVLATATAAALARRSRRRIGERYAAFAQPRAIMREISLRVRS